MLRSVRLRLNRNRSYLDDTLIFAEFPKSGITFGSCLIASLLLHNKKDLTYSQINRFNYFHHFGNPQQPRYFSGMGLAKTHATLNENFRNIIYFYRDPIQVMGSYWKYTTDRRIHSLKPSQFIASKKYGLPAWNKHICSYLNAPLEDRRIVWVEYGQLVANPSSVLEELSMIFGIDATRPTINSIIESCSKNNWIQHAETWNKYNFTFRSSLNKGIDAAFVNNDTPSLDRLEVQECAVKYINSRSDIQNTIQSLLFAKQVS